jgi:hypothetical protein
MHFHVFPFALKRLESGVIVRLVQATAIAIPPAWQD